MYKYVYVYVCMYIYIYIYIYILYIYKFLVITCQTEVKKIHFGLQYFFSIIFEFI